MSDFHVLDREAAFLLITDIVTIPDDGSLVSFVRQVLINAIVARVQLSLREPVEISFLEGASLNLLKRRDPGDVLVRLLHTT